jgi:hypothetical protein
MPLSDTSPALEDVYFRRLAEMTPSEKGQVQAELWRAGHALQCAAVRQRNPDASDDEVIFQVAVARFGLDLARKAYQHR